MKRILLTGGGTGGHIYPLIAVAQALREITARQSIEVRLRYIGATDLIYSAYLRQENIPVSRVANAKLRRYFSLLTIIDGFKFIWSIMQAFIKVALFRPHAAFSKGGPGALPVLLACHIYRIPIIIHESDSVPGLTNRVSGKWARKIELAWETTHQYFPGKDTAAVGIPLRNDLMANRAQSQRDAKIDMGCDPHEPVILVVGGSQGSERINAFILENLTLFLPHFQIIHQTGSANYQEYMKRYALAHSALPAELQKKYHPYAYFENTMRTAYNAADCVISRSGSIIFEIAAFGKPSILIPLPEAAGDHQRMNAHAYARAGGALVIEEQNLTGALVVGELMKIISDTATREAMTAAARSFMKLDAAEKIAADILSLMA